MAGININEFMARFHAFERDLALFDDRADGELWWDSVRFEVCYFLYDCLTGLTYSSAHRPAGRSRALGRARRTAQRWALLTDATLRHRDLLVIRAARSVAAGMRHDVVVDPIIALVAERSRVIDTLPRRYHLPDGGTQAVGTVPAGLNAIAAALLSAYAIDPYQSAALVAHICQLRADYAGAVRGYHRLFDRARPKGVLMVQNGIEKALFHVANARGIPTAEAQHGLIGFAHPNYSYPRDVDYSQQTAMPSLFLTFSEFWSQAGYYPATRHAVIGTDHFGAGIGPVGTGRGTVMVIAADIYNDELLALTRDLAAHLPGRRIVYKLHPNQEAQEAGIRAVLADLPNVQVGTAGTPAVRLMDDVTHLVAIQSTVVYEALQSGRRIVIVPRHDYHLHSDLFGLPAVSLASDGATMAAALDIPADGSPGPTFFERFDPERARAVLISLIGHGS